MAPRRISCRNPALLPSYVQLSCTLRAIFVLESLLRVVPRTKCGKTIVFRCHLHSFPQPHAGSPLGGVPDFRPERPDHEVVDHEHSLHRSAWAGKSTQAKWVARSLPQALLGRAGKCRASAHRGGCEPAHGGGYRGDTGGARAPGTSRVLRELPEGMTGV